jgi:hypothetical protein
MTTITEGTHAAEFLLSEANGFRSREAVTLAPNAAVIPAGQLLGRVTAGGAFVPYANGAADGSEVVAGVLYAPAAISAAARQVTIIARDAEVIEAALVGVDTPGRSDLALLGISLR